MTHAAYNVEKVGSQWQVKADNSKRSSKTASTESEAIDKARKLAKKNAPAEVRVRTSRDGKVHNKGEWRTVHAYHDTHRTVYNIQKSHSNRHKWEVRKEGAKRASKTADSERAAIEKAKNLAKKNKPSSIKVRTSRTGSRHKSGQWRVEHSYDK